ncbi:MAG: PorP/SprF family type IX secretion system membrane protein [Bacteroidota bacterium]
MQQTFTIRLISLAFSLAACLLATAQDIHFSQFYHTPGNLNPALTGVFGADVRFIGNYRSQWQSVPVPYKTFSGSFDTKLRNKLFGTKGYLGYGLVFNQDVAGDGDLSLSQLGANVAYTRQMSDPLFLTLGFQFMGGQRSVEPEKLTFEEQWNGDQFDPNKSSGEGFNDPQQMLGSISTGLNLHYQIEGTRTKMDWGVALFHLNKPKAGFSNVLNMGLPSKLNGYLIGVFQIGERMDLQATGLFGKQTSYQELVVGGGLRYHLNLEKNKELAVQAGLSLRFGDAFIPAVELQARNWTGGVSYDINTSSFKSATLKRGGPEIFLQYLIWKVQPPKEFKSCPIF